MFRVGEYRHHWCRGMQIGLSHLIGGVIALILMLGGSFMVGSQWGGSEHTNSESSETSHEEMASSTDEITHEEVPEKSGEQLYDVVKVVDGDTIVIDMDGKSETIRLIGIDTPETNDARTGVECFGKEATEKLKSVIGDRVSIEKDTSQGERDKYRRLLTYIYTEEGTMLNKYMIAQGYAHEYTYNEPYKYQKEFKAAEADAKKSKRGFWASDACTVPAPKPKTSNVKTQSVKAQTAAAAAIIAPIVPMVVVPTTTPTQSPAQEEPVQKKVEPKPEPKPEPVPEPAPEPKPEPTPVATGSYTCSSNKYNCTDFKTQAEAQAVFDQCGGAEHDVHKLDNNKDGEACESLP